MEKLEIIKKITPLLDRALSDVRKNDILEQRVNINGAIALFAQELENCSLCGQVVINSARYGELLMFSLHTGNYSLFSSVVELLQWHMLEQSPHTGFLWAMTVLLERINELKLFKKVLDIGIVNEVLYKINTPQPAAKTKAKAKAKTPAKAQPQARATKIVPRKGPKKAAKMPPAKK